MKPEEQPTAFEIVSRVLSESSKGKLSPATGELLAKRTIDELERVYKLVKRSTPNLILYMDPATREVHYDGEPGLLTKAISQLVDLKIHEIGSQE